MATLPTDTRPFSPFEWMLALRYLRARRREGFISVLAGFSFLGILLGVFTLITVMAVMNGFRKGTVQFLVATDVAARGIDVRNIEAVFNYDLPQDLENYVHRIGRTGRAGTSGRAYTFVERRELNQLKKIGRTTNSTLLRQEVPALA